MDSGFHVYLEVSQLAEFQGSTHLSSRSSFADAVLSESHPAVHCCTAILMHFATESAYTAGIEYLGQNSAGVSQAMHLSSCASPEAIATSSWRCCFWLVQLVNVGCALWWCFCHMLFSPFFTNRLRCRTLSTLCSFYRLLPWASVWGRNPCRGAVISSILWGWHSMLRTASGGTSPPANLKWRHTNKAARSSGCY